MTNNTNTNTTFRRKSREVLLQALFQTEFTNKKNAVAALNQLKNTFSIDNVVYNYALELATEFDNNSDVINKTIELHSKNWTLERMSTVDRNILRLAVTELKFFNQSVPIKVIIDEAIEIAKKFGTNDSSSFINGILDQVAKRIN